MMLNHVQQYLTNSSNHKNVYFTKRFKKVVKVSTTLPNHSNRNSRRQMDSN